MLEPSMKDMLIIGQDCGLTYITEAYDNYMNHYDMFFLIAKFHEQHQQFMKDLEEVGLASIEDNKFILDEGLTIEDALKKL